MEHSEKPFYKDEDKYYTCECGEHLKVNNTLNTQWYGVLEYMYCKTCKEKMVARNNIFGGIAAP
jgi:predicted SprT family Zn-dependent metalloprotease